MPECDAVMHFTADNKRPAPQAAPVSFPKPGLACSFIPQAAALAESPAAPALHAVPEAAESFGAA